jgi:PIN domain nuclease of toxin-antitoxin system
VTGGFLLDTQALLWLLAGDRRLSRAARQVILKEESKLAVSVASAWEIVLKHRAGKLQLEVDLGEVLDVILHQSYWSVLPIAGAHIAALSELPPLHQDPFDRILVAQAMVEGLSILTADREIRKYPVATVW